MRYLEDLNQEELELLSQVWVRVRAAGLMIDLVPYDDFLDAVVARGAYTDTSEDYLFTEDGNEQ